MGKNAVIGIAILGFIAYLHIRSKRSDTLFENNVQQENINYQLQNAFNISELKGATDDLVTNQQIKIDALIRPILKNSFGRFDLNQHEIKINAFNIQKSGLVKRLNDLLTFQKSLNNDDIN
jgi:hypothetical protein